MNQRGMIYVIALTLVSFLTILSASILTRGLSEARLSERSRSQHTAFQLAEAGLDQAVINLRTSTTSDDVLSGSFSPGTFSILSVTDLGNQARQVTARGISAGEQRDVMAVIQLTGQSLFQFALFGETQVSVSGSASTDSYAGGVYDPDHHNHRGNVGTNATTAGGVTVSGSIFVDGQVMVGPNVTDPTSVVTGYNPAFITGNPKVVSQSSLFPMPAVTVPPGVTCNDSSITGGTTVTLAAGTYCYNDLTISGNATLTATGPVTIYLTGELRASGNSVVGVVDDPTKMVILMTSGSEATLEAGTITGSNEFYGSLYGPNTTLRITGNAEVYGSIIAKEVNLSGSAWIHYDEALAQCNVETPPLSCGISNLSTTKIVSWQDL